MPVKVDEDTVMKAISPGDRVDVMVFLRRNGQDIHRDRRVHDPAERPRLRGQHEHRTGHRRQGRNGQLPHGLAAGEARTRPRAGRRRPDGQDHAHAPPPGRRRTSRRGEEVTPLAEILGGGSKIASEPNAARGRRSPPAIPATSGRLRQRRRPADRRSAEPSRRWSLLAPASASSYEWSRPEATARRNDRRSARTARLAAGTHEQLSRSPAASGRQRLGQSRRQRRWRRTSDSPADSDKDTSK